MLSATVSMSVRGQSEFTAIPAGRSSAASPIAIMLIANFDTV
jgi:hypothetical protein